MLGTSTHIFNSAEIDHVRSSRLDNLEKSDQTKVLLCSAFHTEALPDECLKVRYPSKSCLVLQLMWKQLSVLLTRHAEPFI